MVIVEMSHRSVVLITGAGSGIGRCFMQHYLNQKNIFIIACDINSIDIDVATQNLKTYKVDFVSEESITNFVHKISLLHPEEITLSERFKIDLVIHSAGIRGLVPQVESAAPLDVAAAETLQVMNSETMERTYQINTIGTFTLL